MLADGPPRMEARPTGSDGEPSSPNRCDQCRGKARQPPSHRLARRTRCSASPSPKETRFAKQAHCLLRTWDWAHAKTSRQVNEGSLGKPRSSARQPTLSCIASLKKHSSEFAPISTQQMSEFQHKCRRTNALVSAPGRICCTLASIQNLCARQRRRELKGGAASGS